ncbi:phosphoribosyltransferase [Methylocapsa sp. S129]|uniref:phosphoribosyltransferase n=1 Tax=Methylocapsa sp. S129 TaxID=1641869 RepID=UPI00131E6FC8|nr:phosphoribosyltransferase [Methylocapsa sp. S129]
MRPHDFWQEIHPPRSFEPEQGHLDSYPARFDDGRLLLLPIRPMADGKHALASLIINQAGFEVVDAIASDLAAKLAVFRPEIVVGLPTLGLTLASAVARKLGHSRYAPLGTSRKFWYREELSVALSSITTPDQQKRLYIDPRMLPLLERRRVAVIDDVISSGASMAAAIHLMTTCGVEPVILGAAMLQSDRWKERLTLLNPKWLERTIGVLQSPMLSKGPEDRWIAP